MAHRSKNDRLIRELAAAIERREVCIWLHGADGKRDALPLAVSVCRNGPEIQIEADSRWRFELVEKIPEGG